MAILYGGYHNSEFPFPADKVIHQSYSLPTLNPIQIRIGIPESPYFLLKKGRSRAADLVIQKVAKMNRAQVLTVSLELFKYLGSHLGPYFRVHINNRMG